MQIGYQEKEVMSGEGEAEELVLCVGYSSSALKWGLSPHLPLTFCPLAANTYETQFRVLSASIPLGKLGLWLC